jgi:hypothetical protein
MLGEWSIEEENEGRKWDRFIFYSKADLRVRIRVLKINLSPFLLSQGGKTIQLDKAAINSLWGR